MQVRHASCRSAPERCRLVPAGVVAGLSRSVSEHSGPGRPVGTVVVMDLVRSAATEGSSTLDVEALARYRVDPVRQEMAAAMLARNFSGEDDPPLEPAAPAASHDQNRRAHPLVIANRNELRADEDRPGG